MTFKEFIKFYFNLKISKNRAIRLLFLTIFSYLLFSYILIPIKIHGISMEPTYKTGELRFINAMSYTFSKPKRFDIVTVKFAGNSVMLLKRVVALPGEFVEFRKGKLYINGKLINEPYMKNRCSWELKKRLVKQNHVYVIGDNRNMPVENHMFGQTNLKRIVGKVIWQ